MDKFEVSVVKSIERYTLLEKNTRVLVALSGGPDSVALLLVFNQLREIYPLQLLVAHVNHRLRGKEADEDEQFVRHLCHRFGLELGVKQLNTREEAKKRGANLEEFARLTRYGFLFELAQRQNSVVATGHTLNDQAETFLMRLVRGAGPAGLSGIHPLRWNQTGTGEPQSPTMVIRPLLEQSRRDILGYLSRKQQGYQIDHTNQDLNFDRNWVRHQLIPSLEQRLNPKLLRAVGRTTRLLREMEDFLQQLGRSELQRCRHHDEGEVTLRISELMSLPPIVQKKVVRLAVRESKGDLRGISFQHIERILHLSQVLSGKEVHLSGNLKVQREFDRLRLTRKRVPQKFSYELNIPGEIYVKEVGKYVAARKVESDRRREGSILLRVSGEHLRVRNRRPGDWYHTSGMVSAKKLKELFQRWRVPKSKRDRLVILEIDHQIVWVEGLPVSPRFKVSSGWTEALEIEVRCERAGK